MKKVYTTKSGKQGNCLEACIASILEINIENIPHPPDKEDWIDEINDWLISNHRLWIGLISVVKNGYKPKAFLDNYNIGVGYTDKGLRHAVICRNNQIVHDPTPNSNLTINDITEYVIIHRFFS